MNEYKKKEWLEHNLKKYATLKGVANEANCSQDTIRYWANKYGIPYTPGTVRRHNIDENFFNKIDSEEKAYWLGFIMADGCITTSSKTSPYTRLCIVLKKDDINHLEKFKAAIKYTGAIKEKTIYDKRGFSTTNCTLRVSSKKLCADLQSHGVVPRKTGREIIPDMKTKYVRHFVRGFFDGDGSAVVSQNKKFCRFKICSSSFEIIKQLQSFFERAGIFIQYYQDNSYNVPFYVIESNKESTCNNIYKLLYNQSSIYLDRKYELVKKYCSPTQECVENKTENCWKESQQPAAELAA